MHLRDSEDSELSEMSSNEGYGEERENGDRSYDREENEGVLEEGSSGEERGMRKKSGDGKKKDKEKEKEKEKESSYEENSNHYPNSRTNTNTYENLQQRTTHAPQKTLPKTSKFPEYKKILMIDKIISAMPNLSLEELEELDDDDLFELYSKQSNEAEQHFPLLLSLPSLPSLPSLSYPREDPTRRQRGRPRKEETIRRRENELSQMSVYQIRKYLVEKYPDLQKKFLQMSDDELKGAYLESKGNGGNGVWRDSYENVGGKKLLPHERKMLELERKRQKYDEKIPDFRGSDYTRRRGRPRKYHPEPYGYYEETPSFIPPSTHPAFFNQPSKPTFTNSNSYNHSFSYDNYNSYNSESYPYMTSSSSIYEGKLSANNYRKNSEKESESEEEKEGFYSNFGPALRVENSSGTLMNNNDGKDIGRRDRKVNSIGINGEELESEEEKESEEESESKLREKFKEKEDHLHQLTNVKYLQSTNIVNEVEWENGESSSASIKNDKLKDKETNNGRDNKLNPKTWTKTTTKTPQEQKKEPKYRLTLYLSEEEIDQELNKLDHKYFSLPESNEPENCKSEENYDSKSKIEKFMDILNIKIGHRLWEITEIDS